MKNNRPVIGITMGDPVGIGPELIHLALSDPGIYKQCNPLIIGDKNILTQVKELTSSRLEINSIKHPDHGIYQWGTLDVINLSNLSPEKISWGNPTPETGKAMVDYIKYAIDLAKKGDTSAVTTCPINKVAMKMGGCNFSGHTELLAHRTNTDNYAMMLTGKTLSVILVTIHISLKEIFKKITPPEILRIIEMTHQSLKNNFGIKQPRIAIAGLNPHAGEDGLFGNEETEIIMPAIKFAREKNINASGPFPPDTVFVNARKGEFDAVVCMYHDQGLIPFKLVHFSDGVNTTLGLPIIRTSVDHGTAYNLAGTGKADPNSLKEAIKMAALQAVHVNKNL